MRKLISLIRVDEMQQNLRTSFTHWHSDGLWLLQGQPNAQKLSHSTSDELTSHLLEDQRWIVASTFTLSTETLGWLANCQIVIETSTEKLLNHPNGNLSNLRDALQRLLTMAVSSGNPQPQ